MAIYNYLRPLWRNGLHAVHDLPEPELARLERLLARGRGPGDGELALRLEHEPGLAVAWMQCLVELGGGEGGPSYRRGRYLHAIAMAGEDAEGLTPALAVRLLRAVYGSPIAGGMAAEARFFEHLDHPASAAAARNLFVASPAAAAPGPAAVGAGGEPEARPEPPGARGTGRLLPGLTSSLSALLWYRRPSPPVGCSSAAGDGEDGDAPPDPGPAPLRHV